MGKSSEAKDSLEEKVNALNAEIAILYQKCEEAGYGEKKLQEIFYPVMHVAGRVKWKLRVKKVLYFFLFIGALAGMLKCNATNRIFSVVGKKLMVNYVLPRYDWTWVWNDECLMTNPYYQTPNDALDISECEDCSLYKNVSTVNNISASFMSDTIFAKEPIIINDAMEQWPAITDSLTLEDLSKLYNGNDNLKGLDAICEIRISQGLNLYEETVQELFKEVDKAISEGKEGNFTAYWHNCQKDAARELHKFYYQPYFLPGMCEPNWNENFVLAGRISSEKTKALAMKIDATGFWIAQVHGKMEVVVKPKKICKKMCQPLLFFLKKGQILNVPSKRLYSFGFRPASDSAVALGVGYSYDDSY